MVKTLIPAFCLCLALSLPSAAKSLDSLSGFQELTWRDSSRAVITKLKKRYKQSGFASDGAPVFVGEFAGLRNCTIHTYFKRGELYQARVVINSQDGLGTIDLYMAMFNKIEHVYGKPSERNIEYFDHSRKSLNEVKETYAEEGRVVDEQTFLEFRNAITAGEAYVWARWDFNDGNVIYITTNHYKNRSRDWLYLTVDYIGHKTKNDLDKLDTKDL